MSDLVKAIHFASELATSAMIFFAAGGLIYTIKGLRLSRQAIESSTATVEITTQRTISANLISKKMDVILHCNNRYDALYKDRIAIDAKWGYENRNVEAFFRRFWGLKSDQIDYWFAGFVDPETFASWMFSVVESFIDGTEVGSVPFREGWIKSRDYQEVVNRSLYRMIERLLDISKKETWLDRYASLIVYLTEVEAAEHLVISMLSNDHTHRLHMKKFESALSHELRERIVQIRQIQEREARGKIRH